MERVKEHSSYNAHLGMPRSVVGSDVSVYASVERRAYMHVETLYKYLASGTGVGHTARDVEPIDTDVRIGGGGGGGGAAYS